MIIKFAWKHITSRPLSGALTIIGIALVLSLLGCFWIIKDNINQVQNNTSETASINIFMKTGALNSQVKEVVSFAQKSIIVKDARIVSSDEAFKEFEKQFGETLSKAVSESALPAMIQVSIKPGRMDRTAVNQLVESLSSKTSVLEVDYGSSPIASNVDSSSESRIINWASALFLLVFAITALMISHIIRLAFEGNKNDIETLKILGASRMRIFTPILLEALFYGLSSAVIAIVILNIGVQFLLPQVASFLLPKNFDLFSLPASSWAGVAGVAIAASLFGALMTWPLVHRPARRS